MAIGEKIYLKDLAHTFVGLQAGSCRANGKAELMRQLKSKASLQAESLFLKEVSLYS